MRDFVEETLSKGVKLLVIRQLKNPLVKQRELTSDGTVVMLTPSKPDYLSVRIDFPDGCKTNFAGSVERIMCWYGVEEPVIDFIKYHDAPCAICGCYEYVHEGDTASCANCGADAEEWGGSTNSEGTNRED